MKKMFLTTLLLASVSLMGKDQPEAAVRVQEADKVLREIMQSPDNGIPQDLLAKAHCAVIVPGVKRGGFIVAGQYGKGVMTCRAPEGRGWTGPSTVRMEGGSVGFLIGGTATDVVMLVMNERGAEKLMKSQFTLGGDASVAAGPVGRTATANTDAFMHAEILSWSRSRGVFGGIALTGSTLRVDDSDNATLYGKSVVHADILKGKVEAPVPADGLRTTLNKYSSYKQK